MKTNCFFSKKNSIYPIFGFLSFLFVSCGSYQNSSNYDSDGVYSSSNSQANKTNSQNTEYKLYFKSLQNNGEPEVFVDVENYNSNYNDTISDKNQAYPAWGTTYDNVAVYDNSWGYGYWGNYWSIGFGFGWGYPYYGYGYGWGYPYYGYGYGWGYPYYGYGCAYPGYGYNYSYAYGRRGSMYGSTGYDNNYYYNNPSGRRSTYNSPTRNYSTRSGTPTRNYSYSTQNVRNSTRTYTNSPSRNSSSPRMNSSSGGGGRNYSSGGGGSYGGGGGSYGGGGGGGRSSGGSSGGRR